MTGNWRPVRLGDLVTIEHGFAFDGAYFVDHETRDVLTTPGNFEIGGGFKLDRPKFYDGLVDEAYVLHAGDVIVTMTDLSKAADTLGYSAIVPRSARYRFLHNQRIGKLVLKDANAADRFFLHWVMRSSDYRSEILASASGSTVKHTAPSRIEAYRFRCPMLSEQRAIAATLGALDDKIELNRRMNETLEELARTVFRSWFVDFDPVRAKAAGRTPVGMDAETAALFAGELVQSNIGEIPAGWLTTRLGQIAHAEKGLSYKGAFLSETGPCLLNLGNFAGHGRFLSLKTKHYVGEYRERHTVRAGDLVVANTDITQKRTVIGSPALVPAGLGEPVLFSHHIYAIRFRRDGGEWPTFGFFWLLQDAFRERAQGYATGTTVLALPRDAVLDHTVAIPPESLRRAFMAFVEPTLMRVQQNEAECRTLAELRDLLLPKLVSGELRVPVAEKAVEAVL